MSRKQQLAAEAWESFGRLHEVFRDTFLKTGAVLSLTPGESRALDALDPDEPRPMRSIAEALRCDASNVTWLVDRLESRGFVERRISPLDRRVKAVALTPEGIRTRDEIARRLATPPEQLLVLSAAELRTLRDLLTRVVAASEPNGSGTPPDRP